MSRKVPIDGVELHVRERGGEGTALPFVLLHGLAVSHRYLMPTARRLGPGSVFVPDLAGFGLSGQPAVTLDVGGHADMVAGLLDALGTAPAVVLGNSFGCQVAIELAARRPDLVAALVLTGPTTDPVAASSWGQIRRLFRDLVHEDWRQTPILGADVLDAGPRRILRTLRYAVRDDVVAKFPAIRVPVLLIRGSYDRIAPQSWLDRAAGRIPGARTRTVDGAAHNVVTTAGVETAAAVRTFLAAAGPRLRAVS